MHLVLALAAAIASPAPAHDVSSFVGPLKNCQRASNHFADKDSVYRGDRIKPPKLADLPPANAYASVLRVGPDGCESPLIRVRNVGAPGKR